MNSRAFRVGVLAAVFTSLAISAGCVDNDPIVSGNRVATDGGAGRSDADAAVTVIKPVVPLEDFPDASDVDDPRCRRCATTLNPREPRGTLCRYNANDGGGGSSSATLLNAVVQCACYDKCGPKCGNYCSGGANDLTCSSCLTQNCAAQLGACQNDAPVAP